MGSFRLDRLLEFVTSIDVLVMLLWLGLVALTIALLVLMRTRWGQSRPLRKCLVLSVLAHVLLAGYATTVHIVASGPLQAEEPVTRVSITEERIGQRFDARSADAKEKPWESFVHPPVVQPTPEELDRAEPVQMREPRRQPRTEPTSLPGDPSLENLSLAEAVEPEPDVIPADSTSGPATSSGKAPEPIQAPSPQRSEGVRTHMPDRQQVDRRPHADTSPLEPERSARVGLPTALLRQPLPLPRLAEVQTTPDPERSLAGMSDVLSEGSHGEPAKWSDVPPRPGPRTDVASMPGTGPAPGDARDLRPPSIAMRGDRGPFPAGDNDSSEGGAPLVGPPLLPLNRRGGTHDQLPAIYSLRMAPDRSRRAQLHGATPETEAAVKAALAWLADNQEPEGHWDARKHGAGRELFVATRDRQSAGARADTGITGLALLAFLASGHTHQDGLYKSNVRRGLQYLLSSQKHDGNLGGDARMYAFMYCHAMGTFALSEAFGMTGDQRLREPVRRAVAYTLAAQDPSGGGWRYKPGDPGDTSQLGWQLMALKSAELGGIPIPEQCRQRALRFLDEVSSGQYGGLAAYRPVEPASRAMTAEALVCRVFLGMTPNHPVGKEAGDYLLAELPGQGRDNLYYWYYATLGMYNLQGDHWDRWNDALQKTLLASQQKKGPLAGSWDPDTVWGGYGGRVYSTALAALSLEVYYRFLPLYVEASAPRQPPR